MQITVVQGPARGRTFLLGPRRVVLGRDDSADITLGDPRVSRRHTEIRPAEAGTWIIRDLGSTNHTFLNGQRIGQAILREGDEVTLGDTQISVQGTVVAGESGEIVSMRVDPESLRRTLSDGGEWNAGGKRLQEALFQIGLLADPSRERADILRSAIPIIEEGVPFMTWAWIRWPDGFEQPYSVIGQRGGESVDESTLEPDLSLIKRSVRGRRGVIGGEATGDLEETIRLRRDGAVFAMAVPLLARAEDDTILYFERDFRFPAFQVEDLAWVAALASQLSGHLESARLFSNLRGAHKRLRDSQSQLNRFEKMALIGRLASGFAHDLNNPLTSLLGFLELGRRQADAENIEGKLADYLERAHTAADYCRALCRNLLAFARQRPFSEGEMRPIDIADTIDRTLDICASAVRSAGAEIEVKLTGDLELEGDAATLQQMVMNLIVNAADAVAENPPDRPGRITIAAEPHKRGILLQVSDNGPGIPAEIAASIFEPMVTSKQPQRGTGLGLFVVQRIVDEAGGSIEVESESGGGTTFRLRLNRRLARLTSEELDPQLDRAARDRGADAMSRNPWELPYEVMIVDDEAFVRETLALYLECEGCRVHSASCGEEALEIPLRVEIEAAIVDIRMPGMDGLTLLTELKRRHPDLEVLMATGFQSLETAIEAMRRGACDYITKPITDLENDLLRFVLRAIERRRLRLRNRELSHGLQRTLQELGGLRGEYERHASALEAIEEFGRRTLQAGCREDLLEALTELLPGVSRLSCAAVFLVESGRVAPVCTIGEPQENLSNPPATPSGDSSDRWVDRPARGEGSENEQWFPIWGPGEVRGWILVMSHSSEAISVAERTAIRALADQFALSLATLTGSTRNSANPTSSA